MSSNRLTSLTSFGHLRNLERLDISSNQLDSVARKSSNLVVLTLSLLAELTCLVHLRELNVDNNRISSIDGLSQLDGLIKISMKNNRLSSINFGRTKWRRLESLNLSHNQLVDVSSLDCLESCVSLNLGELHLLLFSSLLTHAQTITQSAPLVARGECLVYGYCEYVTTLWNRLSSPVSVAYGRYC